MPYRINKYDPVSENPEDGSEWYHVATVDRPMQLRPFIRQLAAHGYSEVSLAIDHIEEAKTMTEFEKLVWHMRTAQKVYFKTKSKEALQASRRLEKDVDERLEDLQQPRAQPSLFDLKPAQ